jgi:hypothetical protein
MNHLDKALNHIQSFSQSVEEAILKDEYELIEEDKYDSTILVYGVEVSIWTANEPHHTRIHRMRMKGISMDLEIHFKKFHFVRNAILAKRILSDDVEEHN